MDYKQFFAGLKNKKIAVCGVGVSNTPLIFMLLENKAKVIACDRRTREQIGDIADQLEAAGAQLNLGDGYLENLDVDVIFRTPGMKFNLHELENAREKGIVVTSEMEVFFDLCPAKIFAVTGSDGKTTTTTIISKMLEAEGKKVFVGGNIGAPLLPKIDEIKADDFVVVELSSFQLISMRQSPDVAVVTNVEPNHLDVHKDMDEYVEAKKNVLLHQNAFSRTVLNRDNGITETFRNDVRGENVGFSMTRRLENGAWLDDGGVLHMNYKGVDFPIINRKEIKIFGDHNVANYLTAIAAVWGYVSVENICKVAREFGGVEHRIEFVREKDGVKYYNNSIASSPTRTIAGLKAFDQKVILIAGGYDKNIPFEPMMPYVVEKVKTLYLCGDTAEKIEKCLRNYGGYNGKPEIIRVKNIDEAVALAHKTAVAGDIVTLSPACASFDAYPNFVVRGNHFKQLVNEL